MSETASSHGTSILLPPAGVAVFSKDLDTLQVARNLATDWRFARVRLQAEEGNVQTAIDNYMEMQSPDLVIVQTDTIDDAFTAKLGELAAQCGEGTAAIVVGPVNDVYLYRKLIDMGVSDYLVRPVQPEVLSDVIAKALIERVGITGSRLVAFVGAKGGVGTSVLAQAAAWGISEVLDQKTMLVDCAGGWSTTAVGVGFEPSTTLAEAARAALNNDNDSMKRMIHKAGDKLSVLASGGDVMLEGTIQPEQFEQLVTMLMVTHPVVVLDLSHAPDALANAMLVKASQVVVVSTPALSSLRLARSLIHEIKELRGGDDKEIDLIINMQGLTPKNEVARKDIEQAMEFKVSATVNFDPDTFLKQESQGQKITASPSGITLVRETLLPLLRKSLSFDAASIAADAAPKDSGFLGGILKKIGIK